MFIFINNSIKNTVIMLLNTSNNKKIDTIDIDEILLDIQDIRILYSNPISATTENASSKIEMGVIRTAIGALIGGIQFVFAWIAYPCLLFVSFNYT